LHQLRQKEPKKSRFFELSSVACELHRIQVSRMRAVDPERRPSKWRPAVKSNRVRIAMMSLVGGLLLANQAVADEKLKVAFVEFSQPSGSSWVRANTESTKYLQEHVPDLEITRVESVADGPGVVPVINNLIAKGNKVIFANSYGYGTFIPEIAKKHPEVDFVVQMSDPKGPKNVASYYGKLEEVRYLEGVLAGKMTKTNIVGFAGAYPY